MRREPRHAVARPQAPLDDVVVGLEPQLVRRHRPRRVLVEERRQRVHVVALEGIDVPPQERLLVVVERLDRRGLADRLGRERRPGPLQRAVHRRDGRLEQLRDLFGLPAQDLAQDQHGALLRRQVLERGDERQPDGFARGDRTSAGSPPTGRTRSSGIGSTQAISASGAPSGASAVERALRSIGRARRWLAPSMSRQTFVAMRYSHERSCGAALELVVAAPGPDEGLLDGVLGFERGAEHPVAVAGQLDAIGLRARGRAPPGRPDAVDAGDDPPSPCSSGNATRRPVAVDRRLPGRSLGIRARIGEPRMDALDQGPATPRPARGGTAAPPARQGTGRGAGRPRARGTRR